MFVSNILLDTPLSKNYSYLSTLPLGQGARVIVDFNNRRQVGFVAKCIPADDYLDFPLEKLKHLLEISNIDVAIPAEIWRLCEFTTNYYHHPLGMTLFSAIPTLLRKTTTLPECEIKTRQAYQANLELAPKLRKNSSQAQLWQEFTQHNILTTEQIQQILAKNPAKLIADWLANQHIQEIKLASELAVNQLKLNTEQADVLHKFSTQFGKFHAGLLYGITGSGKTEVFLHLITEILRQGRQVLVLVPEINLTPQLAARFNSRFPQANIIQLNSEISDKQRLTGWLAAKNGQANIILGTRLAIFTPLHNCGLIIIDEEHDDSFKQNDGLRYHARDLAVWRAKQLNIPILLASATPSLETLHNYQQNKYQLYKLTERANPDAALPAIHLINLQHYPVNHAGISQVAVDKIAERLEKQQLSMVFINRRGYAPVITCYECGWVSSCKNCSSKMVYHHNIKRLKCHHCGYSQPIPHVCPVCHNQYLHTIGHGTQKLEEFLQSQFPNARIRRVDRDTTSSKKAWAELYREIHNDEVDILVGTQMLAKGHDFAKLTLVVGLNLDNALFSYDFRAGEDMFNGLTQVAGRAGRAEHVGEVLLQTNYPEHHVYKFLQEHDFNGFINYTLKERYQNKLPPFSHYALFKISAESEKILNQALAQLKHLAKSIEHQSLSIYDPVPAVIYKLHNKYRGQMLISSLKRNELHRYLNQLTPLIAEQIKRVSIACDVDPLEI